MRKGKTTDFFRKILVAQLDMDYRVDTLSKIYLLIIVLTMQSLISTGQF